MEVVRRFVDAAELMSVISLPETMQNRRLEVIVLPAEEQKKTASKEKISDIVDSLTGIIPDEGMGLEEYRAERLRKYEAVEQ